MEFFFPRLVLQKKKKSKSNNLNPLSNSLHLLKGMHVTVGAATGDLMRAYSNWRNRITRLDNFHQAGKE